MNKHMLYMDTAPEEMNDFFARAGADEVARLMFINLIEDQEEWYLALIDFVMMYQSR